MTILTKSKESCGDKKIGGKKNKKLKPYHPPIKNNTKWIEAIIKCKYSAKKIISNIDPLYSTA